MASKLDIIQDALERTGLPYPRASREPLDVIKMNECDASDGGLATSRFQALWNEIVRLRNGIQDYIYGDAPPRISKTEKCPHGRYGYEECGRCIDDYFAKLLSHDEQ